MRSAELLFEDENGRDDDLTFYIRWCYWTHIVNEGQPWGMAWREVATGIWGTDARFEEVGKWQTVLEVYEVIKRVGEALKGVSSRQYVWIWKGAPESTQEGQR